VIINWKKLAIVLPLGIAFFVMKSAYKYHWFSTSLPKIADVENADGTIDYALVGPSGEKYYTSWVLRFPKSLHVSRPGAEGMSGTGSGVSFTTRPNSNGTIAFGFKWPSFEDGFYKTKPSGTMLPADRSIITMLVDNYQAEGLRLYQEAIAVDQSCKWQPTEFPKLFKMSAGDAIKACLTNGHRLKEFELLALIEDRKLLSKIQCKIASEIKDCHFQTYVRNRSVSGDFAMELLPQFAEIHKQLAAFLERATVEDKTQAR
jgi:hypothetical protein